MGSEETIAPQSHYPEEVLTKQLKYAQETIRFLDGMINKGEKHTKESKRKIKIALEEPCDPKNNQ